MPSVINWWLSTPPHTDLWLQRVMFGWQLQEALRREPLAARVLVGVYTRDEHWFRTAYRINTARSQAAGEHWVGVFLEHSQHAECFDSYSTNTWGLSTDGCRAWAAGTYDTVWKSYRDSSWGPVDSTLSTSWSCTTGACPWVPLLAHLRNTTLPMRPKSGTFCNDIHMHMYIQRRRMPIVIRLPVYVGETVNYSTLLFFLPMETSIIMVPVVFDFGIRPPWSLASICAGHDDLSKAGHYPSRSHLAHSSCILKDVAQKVFQRFAFVPHFFGIHSMTSGCPSPLSLQWHHITGTTTRLFVPLLVGANNNKTSKLRITGSLCVESSECPVGAPHPWHDTDTTWASQHTRYRQLDSLFHSLLRLTTNRTPKVHITGPCVCGIIRMTGGLPS